MVNIAEALDNIRLLDALGEEKSTVHALHPLAKLFVTLVFLIIVISFSKHEISALLPMVLFPTIIITLADLPVLPLMKRVLIVLPLVIGIGIFNPLLDHRPMVSLGAITLSYGWISFISIMIKCLLTVITSLILIATTGMTNIALALRKLKVPKIFVLQLLLTYRYITVLMEEVILTTTAYALRSSGIKGIHFKHWGSLLGQLLIRTIDRAQRVYTSMCCRGFDGNYNTGTMPTLVAKDYIFMLFWTLFFIITRSFNLPMLLGTILTGVYP
ncbi:MAG: cobalt ECF transporter T component CbiQ [Firmicutes bacterium HGW-Firmicutes-7]|nr:MAG: cobalt ECF transporter T component CbiQ [Firmicutes bacterium HGW-Firmicutes-7]